jgi:hypothetical protein
LPGTNALAYLVTNKKVLHDNCKTLDRGKRSSFLSEK